MSLRAPSLLDRLSTLGAVLGGLCLAWAGATLALGLTPLVVVSGSMAPAIDTGALAVARTVSAAEVSEGDVVSVHTDGGIRVTHRVVEASAVGDGTASLVLRGDANAAPDPQVYTVAEVERVWFHVPHLGRVVSAASGPGGTLLAVGFVLVAVGTAALPRGGARRGVVARTPRHRAVAGHGRRATVGVVTVTLLASGALVARATPTAAAFTDTGGVTAAPSAGALGTPVISCDDSSGSAVVTWPIPAGPPTSYVVSYRSNTYTVLTNSWTPPPSLIALTAAPVTVTAYRGQWAAGPSNSVSIRVTTVILNLASRCA